MITTIKLGSHTITFEAVEEYHSTFLTSDLSSNEIEELFPMIRVAKNGTFYLPFVVDKVSRKIADVIPGLIRVIDKKVVRPEKVDFNICVTGHTVTKNVVYCCEPIAI